MNIKDFSANETKIDNQQQNKKIPKNIEEITETDDFKKVENEYGDFIQDFVSKYGQMEEQDLLTEMLKLIAEKKAEGDFDAEKIKQIANQIAPLLEPEQQEKMYNLLKYLD